MIAKYLNAASVVCAAIALAGSVAVGCTLLQAKEPRALVCDNTALLPQPERDKVAALCDAGESLERICSEYPKACE